MTAWDDRAACAGMDPELFFRPNKDARGAHFTGAEYADHAANTVLAKAACAVCPITQVCLERALDERDRFALRGGLTADERQSIRRRAERDRAKVRSRDRDRSGPPREYTARGHIALRRRTA